MEENLIHIVVKALKNAGYDPYAQLTGYLETGDDSYITHKDGAREAIKLLDKEVIRAYLAEAEEHV